MSESTLPKTYRPFRSMPVSFNRRWASLLSNAVAHGKSMNRSKSARRGMIPMLVISVADHGPGLGSRRRKESISRNFIVVRARARVASAWDFPIARQLVEAHAWRDRRAKSRRRRRAVFHSSAPRRADAIAGGSGDRMKPLARVATVSVANLSAAK